MTEAVAVAAPASAMPFPSSARPAAAARVRLGIVGCGTIAEVAHLPAALGSDQVEVVALADASTARLQRIQEQCRLDVRAASDYRDLFDDVAAVVLSVPNYLHAPVALEFLRRGIHVLCEKPLAPTHAECLELCTAARSSGAVLAVGYVTRFFPNAVLTKQLLQDGLLGRLVSFDYESGTTGGWQTVSGYNFARATAGGGVLLVDGCHFVDRLIDLFGVPEVIRYEDDSRGGVEANCRISVMCQADGRRLPGEITCSKTHRLANRLRIVGENGSLEIRAGESRSVVFRPAHAAYEHQISPIGVAPDDYFRVQLEDFIQAIQRGTEPRVTGEAASQSVAFIEKCYRMAGRIEEPWVDGPLPRLRVEGETWTRRAS